MKEASAVFLISLYGAVWILAIVGWVMNIIKLIGVDAVGMGIARGIGIIFPPLGAILGWF